jgi:hypothetical protein
LRRIGTLSHVYENGQLQVVEDDVLNVVRKIRDEFSPRVSVYWNDHIQKFTLTETSLDGTEERLIFNVDLLDERVLDRLRHADQWRGREDPAYVLPDSEDFLARIEEAQEVLDAEKDRAFHEKREELKERYEAFAELDGRGVRAQILLPPGVKSHG